MQIARVSAVFRQTHALQPLLQPAYRVAISCGLDERNMPVQTEWSGVYSEPGNRWPFVYRPQECAFEYGSGIPSEHTTFGMRPSIPGELFAVGQSIYEIQACHVFPSPGQGVSEWTGTRMAKVKAACVDRHPGRSRNTMTFLCLVQPDLALVEGEWFGYASDGREALPLVLCVGTESQFDYGSHWLEPTTLRSCGPGERFQTSSMVGSALDAWEYEIRKCDLL